MAGHAPPVATCAGLRSKDLEEGVHEEAEELRTFDSEEEKHPGGRVLMVFTALWLGCRFGWWSTMGVGAAWSSSL